jgi:hypothetical protein
LAIRPEFFEFDDIGPKTKKTKVYRYTNLTTKQRKGGQTAIQVAELVVAAPNDDHRVATAGSGGWKVVNSVPEIQKLLGGNDGPPDIGGGDGPPDLGGSSGPGSKYHYTQGTNQQGELTAADIAEKWASAGRPEDHKVWSKDLGSWTPVKDVSEITSRTPPPLPPADHFGDPGETYHYAQGSTQKGETSAADIAKQWADAGRPDDHKVWKDGMGGWTAVKDVSEIVSRAPAAGPPPLGGGGPPPLGGGGPPPL